MNRGTGARRGRDDPPDHSVETLQIDGERAGHGGAHRDLDRNDDLFAHRLDDPAESAQRDESATRAGIPRAIDRKENLLEDGLDVRIAPCRRVGAVLEAFGGRVIAFAENDFDVEFHLTIGPSIGARVFRETQ